MNSQSKLKDWLVSEFEVTSDTWEKLFTGKIERNMLGQDKLATQVNNIDINIEVPICIGAKEAPTPERLIGIISSIQKKKYDYIIDLYPNDADALDNWYKNNNELISKIPRENIRVYFDWRNSEFGVDPGSWLKTYETFIEYRKNNNNEPHPDDKTDELWLDTFDRYMSYCKKNNLEVVAKKDIDRCKERFEKADIKKTEEEIKEHIILHTIDTLFWMRKQKHDRGSKNNKRQITGVFYKNDQTITCGKAIGNYEKILGEDKKQAYLLHVKYELGNAPIPVKNNSNSSDDEMLSRSPTSEFEFVKDVIVKALENGKASPEAVAMYGHHSFMNMTKMQMTKDSGLEYKSDATSAEDRSSEYMSDDSDEQHKLNIPKPTIIINQTPNVQNNNLAINKTQYTKTQPIDIKSKENKAGSSRRFDLTSGAVIDETAGTSKVGMFKKMRKSDDTNETITNTRRMQRSQSSSL